MGLLIASERTSTQQTNPRSRPEQTCLTGVYSSTCKYTKWIQGAKRINSYKNWKISTRQCFNGDFHSTVSIHEMINSNVQHRFEEVPLNLENSSVKLQVYQGVFSPRSLQGFGCRRSLGSSWLLEWRARFAAFCRSGSQRHAAASYLYKWKWQRHFISYSFPLNSLCHASLPLPTICVLVKTIDAKEKVGLFDLLGSDLCHGLNWIQTAVLSQRHWDHLQSISKGPHGILFQCGTLKNKTNRKETPSNKYQITKKKNMLMANCMLDLESRTLSAASLTARAQAISEAPPPYTIRLSLTRLRITQRASWRARFASSTI